MSFYKSKTEPSPRVATRGLNDILYLRPNRFYSSFIPYKIPFIVPKPSGSRLAKGSPYLVPIDQPHAAA